MIHYTAAFLSGRIFFIPYSAASTNNNNAVYSAADRHYCCSSAHLQKHCAIVRGSGRTGELNGYLLLQYSSTSAQYAYTIRTFTFLWHLSHLVKGSES